MTHHLETLVFLGTGSHFPTLDRNVSSVALRLNTGKIWLFDCGEGTAQQALKCKLKLSKISNIFITHLHGDHSFGLPGLLTRLSFESSKKGVTCYGPHGLSEFIQTSLRISDFQLTYQLKIVEFTPGQQHTLGKIDGVADVTAYPLKHRVPCFGFLIVENDRPGRLFSEKALQLGATGKQLGILKLGNDVTLPDGTVIKSSDVLGEPIKGKKVLILGDNCDASCLDEFGQACDLLVHEATFDAQSHAKAVEYQHSTSVMAGAFAARIKAKKMILTHFSVRYSNDDVAKILQEAQMQCPKTLVIAAKDLDEYVLKSP